MQREEWPTPDKEVLGAMMKRFPDATVVPIETTTQVIVGRANLEEIQEALNRAWALLQIQVRANGTDETRRAYHATEMALDLIAVMLKRPPKEEKPK